MIYRKSPPLFLLLALTISCCIAEYFAFRYVLNLIFTKSTVYNTNDKAVFTNRKTPRFNFVFQDRESDNLKYFKEEIKEIISRPLDELSLAIEIRKWGRRQQVNFGPGGSSDNPIELLKEQRAGAPGACRRFGVILTTALVSAGFDARLVGAAPDFNDQSFNHTFVEVWIEKLNKWILIDSTYDCLYLVDGKPASLIEIYETVKKVEYGRISFQRDGSSYFPKPEIFTENGDLSPLIQSFRHIYFALSNAFADGYCVRFIGEKRINWVHYYDELTPRHPDAWKKTAMGFMIINPLVLCAFLIIWVVVDSSKRKATISRK